MEYFSNWKWWETEQLHSAAAIRRKLREVVMCNYRPNSQFNSHNRTVQAVTPQQKPHLQRQDRWSKDGNFKKKPCGADIRRLIHGGGIKNHRWRNSIDVFDGGIWATIEQILTAASFPPFLFSSSSSQPFKALVIIAHTQRREQNKAHWQLKRTRSHQTHSPPVQMQTLIIRLQHKYCASTRVREEENESV